MPELIVRKWDGPYSFMIFREYGVYKARRGDTGEVQYEDPSARVVMQNAADSLLQGGTIFVKGGVHEVDWQTSLNITNSNIEIVGEGDATIIRHTEPPPGTTTGGQPVIKAVGVDNIKVRNIQIFGQTTVDAITFGEVGIQFDGVTDFEVKNCYFKELTNGAIDVRGGSKNGVIAGNRLDSGKTVGTMVGFYGATINQDITVEDNIVNTYDAAFNVSNVKHVSITGNICNAHVAVDTGLTTGQSVEDFIFEGNLINAAGGRAIQIYSFSNADYGDFKKVKIRDNVIYGQSDNGIRVWNVFGAFEDVEITGNVIIGGDEGIEVNPGADKQITVTVKDNIIHDCDGIGLLLRSIIYSPIEGNVIFNCGKDTGLSDPLRAGIHIYGHASYLSQYNSIRNNIIYTTTETQRYGIYIYDTTRYTAISGNIVTGHPLNGIIEQNTADYNVITNNDVRGNTGAGIVTVGANTEVRNNKGYITENSGTATGTGAQQTIAHGCDFTPTKAHVIVSNIDDGANPYLSANPDATNIYVTAVSGKDYRWEVKLYP